MIGAPCVELLLRLLLDDRGREWGQTGIAALNGVDVGGIGENKAGKLIGPPSLMWRTTQGGFVALFSSSDRKVASNLGPASFQFLVNITIAAA